MIKSLFISDNQHQKSRHVRREIPNIQRMFAVGTKPRSRAGLLAYSVTEEKQAEPKPFANAQLAQETTYAARTKYRVGGRRAAAGQQELRVL